MKKHSMIVLISFFLITILMGCPGSIDTLSNKDLGNDYLYHEWNSLYVITKEFPTEKLIVPIYVKSYDFNHQFIIASQISCDFINLTSEEIAHKFQNDYYDLCIKYGTIKYWIIDKKIDSVYGPMTKREYFKKRYELRIPKGLKLKDY